ncbi:MAG: TonB family protein [Planctomycetia bacterium]|nr:TonB family protein [Planctomycetia bacterium]
MIAEPEARPARRAIRGRGPAACGAGWRSLGASWSLSAFLHGILLGGAAILTSVAVSRGAAKQETLPVRLDLGGARSAGEPGLPGGREEVASRRPAVPELPAGEFEAGEPPLVPPDAALDAGAPPAPGRTAHEDLMFGHVPEHAGRGPARGGRGIPGGSDAGAPSGGEAVASGPADRTEAGAGPGSDASGDGEQGRGADGGDAWARRSGGRLPVYPAAARRRGLEGTTILDLDVAADGRVTGVRVSGTSGHRLLDTAAEDAAWTWTFLPLVRDARAESSRVTIPVTFRLTD